MPATTERFLFWFGRTSEWSRLFPPSTMPPQPLSPGGKSVVEGLRKEVNKSACIGDDNKHMAGVDGLDQMISYYPLTTKSVKSTTKVLFYLMEISVHNAYVLYKAKSSTKHNTMFNSCCNLLSSCCHSKRRMHRRPTMKVRMMLTCFKVCLRCNSIIFSVPFYLKT